MSAEWAGGRKISASVEFLLQEEVEATMRPKTFTGTSGYSYDDWRGAFYPLRLAKGKMLEYTPASFPSPRSTPFLYIPPVRVVEGRNWPSRDQPRKAVDGMVREGYRLFAEKKD
ncbi:MAG: hypothetical protein AB1374_05020 [Bacillota bacterium]